MADEKRLLDKTVAEAILDALLKRPELMQRLLSALAFKSRLDEGINYLLQKIDLPAYPSQRGEVREIVERVERLARKLEELEKAVSAPQHRGPPEGPG
jgi:replicative superfamily II helicase